MIDWGKILEANDLDALKEAKLWLFQENIRLENERKSLEESKDRFLKDRIKYKEELESLNRQTVIERKRLKEENMFFDKKMMILRAGFAQLEADRMVFEKEKQQYLSKRREKDWEEYSISESNPEVAQRLFQNVKDPISLRKRYRDLVKIFHPDNLHGDSELVQMINKEFFRRKKEE